MVISDFYYDSGTKPANSEQLFEREYYDKYALENEIYPHMLFSGTYYKFGINPCCWSKVYKKELLKKNLFPVDDRIKLGEDAAFTYPCLLDAQNIATVKTPCYHYILNPQSMTKSYDKDLQDIIFLPYAHIKEKCREIHTDLGTQPDYYLLYLANFLIRNETKSKNPGEGMQKLLANADVRNAAKRIDRSILPFHTKLFAFALKMRSKMLLRSYMTLLKTVV